MDLLYQGLVGVGSTLTSSIKTDLIRAVRDEDVELVRKLLQPVTVFPGAPITVPPYLEPQTEIALKSALEKNNLEIMELLLDNLSYTEELLQELFNEAIDRDQIEMIDLLIGYGAVPVQEDIIYSIVRRRTELFKYIYSGDLNQYTRLAIDYRAYGILEFLYSQGAIPIIRYAITKRDPVAVAITLRYVQNPSPQLLKIATPEIQKLLLRDPRILLQVMDDPKYQDLISEVTKNLPSDWRQRIWNLDSSLQLRILQKLLS